ncbi:MAG: hypothetical protein AAF846_02905 [Chloroflexota bacterium]
MAEYQAFDPEVEVYGQTVMSFLSGLKDEVIPVLKEFDLYPLEADQWYPQTQVLGAYEALNERDFMNLVAVGMKIPDQAEWPPEVVTVHDALGSLDVVYNMNHRGGEIGEYRYEKTGERSGIMFCHNPYPSDFDYGLVYRIVQKFRGADSTDMLVKRDESKPSRRNGGESCTFLVLW